MEISQLRALREVHDRGSIAAAAQSMAVTASSVSQQLAALQRKAGTALTYKIGRRTALTPAGLALCAATVEVEIALAKADAAVGSFKESTKEPVRVAAFHSAGLAFFGRLERAVMAGGGPPVQLSDQDVAQKDFATLAADHDIVIAHRMPNSAPWPPSVRVTPLAYEPLDVAVSVNHRLATRKSLKPQDLLGERWVSVHQGFPLVGAIEMIGTMAGEEVDVVHRINEFFVAAALVEQGGCVSLMPRYLVDQSYFSDLILIPLSEPRLGRRIDILARPEAMERAGVLHVVATLQTIMRELLEPPHSRRPIPLEDA
ncbi:DNA-binding transcriptional regulator, LysR family [Arthrobacter alpinus]|uniref:DNA-binding transcriptional regulator, LysR family n=1 Tax=Arthrobacter alpinus TaxID=656366 RepID=A0A1H5MV78_9MICC|nr:LysR family transcriptional regulator [Arthrobacter alpinus]SEE93234.1 DNA-binding transcriptional regulator, LysR family [Arthrobacter alpinus]